MNMSRTYVWNFERLMKNTEEIKKLLSILKGANKVYQNCDNDQRIRLMEKCQWIFDRLQTLGAAPGFCEALVIYGKEFLVAEYPPDPHDKEPATIEDAEKIFGVKAKEMSEYDQRVHSLAEKHGAMVYRRLSKDPEAPKIEVLVKKPNVTR